MNDQENIIRLKESHKVVLKVKVPLTGEDLFNLMKGGRYDWDQVPHDKEKEYRVDLQIYGIEEEENILKELFSETPADDTYKYGRYE